tara:strand:- start:22 stop:210 length:189 start_codon:yes stop_codon:yes gene_type:complete
MLYIVYDSEQESIRRFHSKLEAEYFIKNKPEFTMKKIVEKRNKLRKMSDYEIAVKTCKPCLI